MPVYLSITNFIPYGCVPKKKKTFVEALGFVLHTRARDLDMEKKRSREPEVKEVRAWAELVLPWLAPPDLAAVASASKALRSVAMGVSSRRASDASRGLERHPVPFLNPVDAQPYSYFLYVRFPLLAFPSTSAQPWGGCGPTPPDPSSLAALDFSPAAGGCACALACASECPCSSGPEPGMELMTECGANCPCGPECGNRVTQGGISIRLRVVKHPHKGWGLHTAQFVKRGEFICEYAGISFSPIRSILLLS